MSNEDLKQRTRIAIFLIGLVVFVGFLAALFSKMQLGLLGIAILALGLAASEFSRVCSKDHLNSARRWAYFITIAFPLFGLALWLVFVFDPHNLGKLIRISGVSVVACSFLALLSAMLYLVWAAKESLNEAQQIAKDLLVGLLLINFCGSTTLCLTLFPASYKILLWLLLVVCINDTAAYFVGKKLLGPKLAPNISPNKTISGSVGGLLAGTIVGVLAGGLVASYKEWPVLIILAVVTVIAGQIGDLMKSYIKRLHSVKDMGTCLPGHGGILDRIDGILAASPVLFIWICFQFMKLA